MAYNFTFGDVILQVLENEDRKSLERQRMADERSYRTETLKQSQQQLEGQQRYQSETLRQGQSQLDEQRRQFEALRTERLRENPDINLNDYLGFLGFSGTQKTQVGDALKSGTLASRHNNPLNIKYGGFAKKFGATEGESATDGGTFAKFPNVETGLTAATSLLQSGSYSSLTVDSALKRWSNKGYGDEIVPELRGRVVGSLSDAEMDSLVNKMAVREGSISGGANLLDSLTSKISKTDNPLDIVLPFKAAGQIVDDLLKRENYLATKEQREYASFVRSRADELKRMQVEALEANKSAIRDILGRDRTLLSEANFVPTPTFSEGVQGFIETGFQAPGTPGFMRSAQKFANREAMLQRNLDRARPGLYSNLNLVENLLSRVGKLGYITDADVGYIQDLQGEFTRMKSLPINFGAPLVSRGEVGTVGGTIDKAQSLLSTLLGMRFNAAALQQLLKSTAQEDAEAQGKIKVKQYEEEQP